MAQIAPPCERTDSDEKKKSKIAIGFAELLRVPHQIHSYRSGTSDITDFDEQIAFSCTTIFNAEGANSTLFRPNELN